MFRMLSGRMRVGTELEKSMNLTTFEALVILTKVGENQAGKETMTLRSDLLDLGLESVAPIEDETKSRFGRIEEMLGSEGDTSLWVGYEKNPEMMERSLQIAGACTVLVATLERGEANTLDVITFVDKNDNIVAPERISVLSTTYLAEIADGLYRGLRDQRLET
jgi:hypothetical protein